MRKRIELTHNEVKRIIAKFFGANESEVRFDYATKFDDMENLCVVIEQKHINLLPETPEDEK